MTAIDAADVVLSLGDGGAPVETFTPVAGVRAARVEVAQDVPEVPSVGALGWRRMQPGMGTRRVRVVAEGVLDDGPTDAALRGAAMGLALVSAEVAFPSGESWRGTFAVTAYRRLADRAKPAEVAFTLESAGAVSIV